MGLPVVSIQTTRKSRWLTYDPPSDEVKQMIEAKTEFISKFQKMLVNLNNVDILKLKPPINGYFLIQNTVKLGSYQTVSFVVSLCLSSSSPSKTDSIFFFGSYFLRPDNMVRD
jgi:hypothetical protein